MKSIDINPDHYGKEEYKNLYIGRDKSFKLKYGLTEDYLSRLNEVCKSSISVVNKLLVDQRDAFDLKTVLDCFENRGAMTIEVQNKVKLSMIKHARLNLPEFTLKEGIGSDQRYNGDIKIESKMSVAEKKPRNGKYYVKHWQGMAYARKDADILYLSGYNVDDDGITSFGLIIVVKELCPLTFQRMEDSQTKQQKINEQKIKNGKKPTSARAQIIIVPEEFNNVVPVMGQPKLSPKKTHVELILKKC